MIRVLVVDDHPVVLAGLGALIGAEAGLDLVASASCATEAAGLAPDPPPDVCVVDLHLPDGDGIALGVALKQRWPQVRVLLLTMHADAVPVVRTLSAGLDGYLLKDSDPAGLCSAIRSAASGSLVLGRGVSGPIVAAASSLPEATPLARLDARDREILGLLTQGLTTSQVADRLFLSPKTIRNRISDLLGKLGVGSRDEAVALARAGGLGS